MHDDEPIPRTDVPAAGNTVLSPTCLALHGLGGGPYEIGPLIDALEADGLTVEAPILPGHEPKGRVMPASSWCDWAAASEAAFDSLAAGGRPVVVIGFSTGGTLALASGHPPPGRANGFARAVLGDPL